MEHDKSSASAATLDCCFHPTTIDMSLKTPGFKDLVVETARETCVRGFKNVKDDIEVDVKYHVLKGVTYKSGEVVTMIISKEKSKGKWEEKKKEDKKPVEENKAGPSKEQALKKGFMTAKKTTRKGGSTGGDKTGGGGKRGGEIGRGAKRRAMAGVKRPQKQRTAYIYI